MKVKHLAEAVILQAIEDLWNEDHRKECIDFFAGEDFRACASLAGMDIADKIEILKMLDKLIKDTQEPLKTRKRMPYKYISLRPEMRGAPAHNTR